MEETQTNINHSHRRGWYLSLVAHECGQVVGLKPPRNREQNLLYLLHFSGSVNETDSIDEYKRL